MENEISHAFVPDSKEAGTNNVYLNVYYMCSLLPSQNLCLMQTLICSSERLAESC